MKLSFPLIPLSFGKSFDVDLRNDLYNLSVSSDSNTVVDYKRLQDTLESNGWKLVPVVEGLESSAKVGGGKYNQEEMLALRRNKLHTLYKLVTSDGVSYSDVKDELLPNSVVSFVTEEPALVDDKTTNPSLRGAGNLRYILEADNRDWTLCDRFPCQGYLLKDETPSEYTLVGNNVKRVWEEFGVKGEGVRWFHLEWNGLLDTTHPEFVDVNPQLINDEYIMGSQKNQAAGLVLAKHDNIHMSGIAPNVRVIDVQAFEDARNYQKIYDSAKYGDVVLANLCFWLELAEIPVADNYDPHCREYYCSYQYPATFLATHNRWFNLLHEKGVTVIVGACNGSSNLGNGYYQNRFPTSERGVESAVMVSSWDPKTNRAEAYTNYVADPIIADGFVDIKFANWGNHVITTSVNTESGYVPDYDGSRAAAPITSGVFALVQSAAVKYLDRKLSPGELTEVIYRTGTQVGYDPEDPRTAAIIPNGIRIPDAYEAVKRVIKMAEDHECDSLGHWEKSGVKE